MINDLASLQEQSKHGKFAKSLCRAMIANNIKISASALANEFNKKFEGFYLTPSTTRNWLIGATRPRKPILAKLTAWLKLEPESVRGTPKHFESKSTEKYRFSFDFKDQEVIAKYLAMTDKQKVAVRLFVDAIADKKK